jgi:hypothetical protein
MLRDSLLYRVAGNVELPFFIEARWGDQGYRVEISETGINQPYQVTAEKYVVLECLRALANVGYNIPSFSSMLLRALDEGVLHDVAGLCATVAQ